MIAEPTKCSTAGLVIALQLRRDVLTPCSSDIDGEDRAERCIEPVEIVNRMADGRREWTHEDR